MNKGKRVNSHNKKNDQREWGLLLLIFAIFLFIGGLFIGGERGSNEQSSVLYSGDMPQYHQKRQLLKRLDYDLKDSSTKADLNRDMTIIEHQSAAKLDESSALESNLQLNNVNPLSLDQESVGKNVLNDTEGRADPSVKVQTPEQRISSKIARDQWSQEHDQRYREEYIKQFLENAKRSGVDIRLNDNLDVTGIDRFEMEKPIRIPQSESNGSVSGAK